MVTLQLEKDDVVLLREVLKDYLARMQSEMPYIDDLHEKGVNAFEDKDVTTRQEEIINRLLEHLDTDVESQKTDAGVQENIKFRNTEWDRDDLAA